MQGAAVIVQQSGPRKNEGAGVEGAQMGARICPAFDSTYQFAVMELVAAKAATENDIVRIADVFNCTEGQDGGAETGLNRLSLQGAGLPVINLPATDIVGEPKRFDSCGKGGQGEIRQQKEMDFNGSISSRALQKRMFSHETSI